jgi:hypothetical protein
MEKDLPKFIRAMWHLRDLVIPAKARIYSANLWKCAVVGLDSRFRGNDRGLCGNHRGLERIPIPNDPSAQNLLVGQFDVEAALRRHLVRQVTDKLAATASN